MFHLHPGCMHVCMYVCMHACVQHTFRCQKACTQLCEAVIDIHIYAYMYTRTFSARLSTGGRRRIHAVLSLKHMNIRGILPCVHTHVHMYVHRYIHAYTTVAGNKNILLRTHKYMQTCMCTHTCTYIHCYFCTTTA